MLLNIQVLRAVAAYLVVLVHLGTLLFAVGVSGESTLIGNCGVDLFFVISGYLMILTTAEKSPSASHFIVNRVIRVVPMYWLCTLGVFTIALFAPSLLISTSATVDGLVESLLFIPFEKYHGQVQPILFLGWTLNYEMFFYCIFALSLLLPRRLSVVAALIVISTMPLFGLLFAPMSVIVRFYVDPIMLEFVMGMMCALALARWRPLSLAAAWTALIAGGAVMLGRYHFVPLGERALWSGLPATAILCGAISLEMHGRVWRNGFMQLLGASSYSLYLIHPFVIQAFAKVVPVSAVAGSPVLPISAILIVLLLVGGVAIALHRTIERPLTRWLRVLAGHR